MDVTRVWLAAKLGFRSFRVLAALAYSRSVADARCRVLASATLALLAVDGAVWGAAGAWVPGEFACLTCAVLCSVALMATRLYDGVASVAYVTAMLVPWQCCRASWDALGVFVSMGTTLVCSVSDGATRQTTVDGECAHEATEG
jgi:hypothetical protein